MQLSGAAAGNRESTLSAGLLRELVDAVERAGVSRHAFVRAAQLEALAAGDSRVPLSAALRALELAIELSGDTALGLHWCEQQLANSHEVIWYLLVHAQDLRTAFRTLFEYSRLMTDELRITLTEQGDDIIVRSVAPRGVSPAVEMVVAELVIVGFYRLLCAFDAHAQPKYIRFRYRAPVHRGEYTRLLGPLVSFDQPFTELVFDRSLMSARSRWKDDDLHVTLRAVAQRRLSELDEQTPYVARVRAVLASHEAPQPARMPDIARSLQISPRSLYRRLSDEGQSFDRLACEASALRAKRLLFEERRTIHETAEAMGYGDRSAFHRAFKRWTGTTPHLHRKSS
jgi:AraC-like DNA-binding protein